MIQFWFAVMTDFAQFLKEYPDHVPGIAFSVIVLFAGILDLLVVYDDKGDTHAWIGPNGNKPVIACGDWRVLRLLSIFGGPAALTFGVPYFYVFRVLEINGYPNWLMEYVAGFAYVTYATSMIWVEGVMICTPFVFHDTKPVIWFMSHFNGCGWITSSGPFWFLYWLQRIFTKYFGWLWLIRDIETGILFALSIPIGGILVIGFVTSILSSLVASLSQARFSLKIILPGIWFVDELHPKHS